MGIWPDSSVFIRAFVGHDVGDCCSVGIAWVRVGCSLKSWV